MSLFQKSVLKKQLQSLDKAAVEAAWQRYAAHFLDVAKQENIRNSKEEQYQEGFLRELFVDVLGYVLNPSPGFNLTTELKNIGNAKKADGGIVQGEKVLGVIELKGTETVNLDKVTDQAFGYKSNQRDCRYVIVSNFERLRLYVDDATDHEEFDLFELTPDRFRLLYLLLAADYLFAGMPARMKQESALQEKDITDKFYKDYSAFKNALFEDLVRRNPHVLPLTPKGEPTDAQFSELQLDRSSDELTGLGSPLGVRGKTGGSSDDLTGLGSPLGLGGLAQANGETTAWHLLLFKKSQKLLDRLLFIFFGEDKGLLPPNLIKKTVDDWDRLRELDEYRPLYDQFKKYFQYINEGTERKDLSIFAYNGGLFEPDEVLDSVKISDPVLYKYTLELTRYDFDEQVDVNILGHIFEHSLNEIEEISAQLDGTAFDKTQTKRKKDGVFYTPRYITQYIVENTVGRLCTERKAALGIVEADYAQERKGRRKDVVKALDQRLKDYEDWLFGLKICDPACGSGAFLNEAFDFLIREHGYVAQLRKHLFAEAIPFSVENSILERNIYGVDINEEAVEIARLSLWLRSAEPGRKLTKLSGHIKVGNSLIDDPAVAGEKAFSWEKEFPEVFEQGGFDVVVGNPPYVRQEVIKDVKPFLSSNYSCFSSRADLYVYFYEKGLKILKEHGVLSYVSANKFIRGGYGEELRRFLETYNLIVLIDFGELPVFSDAATFPVILVIRKKPAETELLYLQVKDLSFSSLNELLDINSEKIPTTSVSGSSWSLKSNSGGKLLDKIISNGNPLSSYTKDGIKNGIRTGFNPAFIIDEKTKDELIKKDSRNSEVIKPLLEGKDLNNYSIDFGGNWVIFSKHNGHEEFVKSYPLLAEYLGRFEKELRERGQVKNGQHHWIELDNGPSSEYQSLLESPKVIYPEMSIRPKFNFDDNSYYVNNKVFFIPNATIDLLPILNSKLIWYFLKNTCSCLGDPEDGGRLELRTIYMKDVPIAKDYSKELFGTLAVNRFSLSKNLKQVLSQFTRLLRRRFDVEQLPQKLEAWHELSYKDFCAELNKLLQKVHKRKLSIQEDLEWEPLFEEQRGKAAALQADIQRVDREIDGVVYGLYGLTETEIKIIEGVN